MCAGFFMLNRELSVSLLRRLAIVLSPVKSSRMILLPPEGAGTVDDLRCETLPTNHYPLPRSGKISTAALAATET